MSEKMKNSPKLRFPEFVNDGEWEEKPLSDVSEVIMGQSPDSNTYNTIQDGKPLIQGNADIFNRKTNPRIWTSEPTKECQDGDIILTVRAPVGAVAKSFHNACIGRGVCAIQPKENNEFLYQFLLTQEDKWDKLSQGSTFTAINSNDIRDFKLKIPKPKEQQKIADCLSSIDGLISAQSQKVELLKEHKKGLIQQLFPSNHPALSGTPPTEGNVPKLRFPEFVNDGEWEEKKLGDLILTVTPPKKLLTNQYLDKGIFPVVDQSQKYIIGWTNDQEAIIKKRLPLIIFGDHTCALKLIHQPFAQGADGIKIFEANSDYLTTNFLYQFLQFNPLKMEDYKRHFSILKDKIIKYPNKRTSEQQKIADCLSSIDEQINQQTSKLQTLKEHKKALMQQLFPSSEA